MVDARRAAAAGVFYPSTREALASTVRSLLDAASTAHGSTSLARVHGIVVPHGLYARAGSVMAAAWALVASAAPQIRRVALLGPAHHVPLLGLAAPFADAFATPLGAVAVDRIAIETARRLPQLFASDVPHEQEHSLEVHLPFLQTVAPSATIVPLIVGDATTQEGSEVLDLLWDDATLAVVSTDLSQYYDAKTAEGMDEQTARAIESLDGALIHSEQACGHAALRGLLAVSRARGLRAVRLELTHAGEQDEVLGFGAFAIGSG
jgi:AmmeMemoRadiSam system protein B